MSIRTQIILALIPAILFFLGLLLITNFTSSKQTVLELINHEAHQIASNRVMEFDVVFESAEKIAEGISISIGTMKKLSKEEIQTIILETLKKNKSIFGSTTSFIPLKTDLGNYAPYYHQLGDSYKYVSLDTPEYNYPEQKWFKEPLKEHKGVWSKPYMDEGGGDILMTTYSIPIIMSGEPIGVATVDISLENLVQRVRKLTVSGKGYAFLVSQEGNIIAHPEYDVLSKKTIFELAENSKDENLKKLANLVKNKGTSFVELTDPFYKNPSVVLTTKITPTDWTLVLIYPRDEVLKPLNQLKDKNIMVSLFVLALLIVVILYLSSTLTSPITRLVEQTKVYSEGAFDQKLDEFEGTKEIRQLSQSFNMMGQAIIEQIENVKQTTAQKERFEQELLIAAEIQQSILPQKVPPFPELIDKIDLYGTTKPARQIGGDYYDYFTLPNDRIAFVVADVSDKGAPSSFFMAMTRMLVREIAERGFTPVEVLRRANYRLALDNPHCMFVTIIYAEYDLNTGILRMVNAGHNPPLRLNYKGEVEVIQLNKSLPLGIEPSTIYKETILSLVQGDTLLLYTDGVTEAQNAAEQQYGMERLKNVFSAHSKTDSIEIVKDIMKNVADFSSGVEQLDDITLVCLKNLPRISAGLVSQKMKLEETVSVKLPAKTEVLERLANLTTSVARDCGFEDKDIYKINLAIDEIVSNVIMHAYDSKEKETFQVDLIPRIDGLYVAVIDYGKPFDFDKKVDAYNEQDASIDQSIGGIGLHLASKSVDEIWYEPSSAEGNKVIFIKYLPVKNKALKSDN